MILEYPVMANSIIQKKKKKKAKEHRSQTERAPSAPDWSTLGHKNSRNARTATHK